jgi:hypothetical protein
LGGATWTGGAWTLGLKDYWSPDNAQFFGNSNAIEGSVAYAFTNKLWNFFTPSISGNVGFQSYEINADDYVYWNAGLTLGFLERWSADIRYYDTDYNSTQCFNQSGGRTTATRGQWVPSRPRSKARWTSPSTSIQGRRSRRPFLIVTGGTHQRVLRQMTRVRPQQFWTFSRNSLICRAEPSCRKHGHLGQAGGGGDERRGFRAGRG